MAVPTSPPVSFRLDAAERERLERLAELLDRRPSDIAREAVRAYLDLHEWQIAQIEAALAKAEAGGPFISHEEVLREVESWGEDRSRS
jgi:predicted transcriptional regulator